MFNTAFVEERQGELEFEERLVCQVLEQRGIPAQAYTRKRIDRRDLPLDEHSFIMGATPSMHGAMKQLGIPIPLPNDYPKVLTHLLHRDIWLSTLGEVEQRVSAGSEEPVFIKPAERLKNFTGRVIESPSDLYFMGNASRRQKVWCSQVVQWRSEFRAYVVGTDVVGLDHYGGDENVRPCDRTIAEAVKAYRASGEAPAAYGIDFGVLKDGQTALVEANDGYSLGAYKVAAIPYAEVLFVRWAELLATRKPVPGPGLDHEP